MMNLRPDRNFLSSEIAFNQQAINIGADQNNDIVLRGSGLADFLMMLVYEAGTWTLMPLNTQPPIFVDGRQISEAGCKLPNETEISVGAWALKARLNGISTDFLIYESRNPSSVPAAEPEPEAERRILLSLENIPSTTVEAGSEIEYDLSVTNAGPLVANMQLQVQGIPADWVQIVPPVLNLNEGRRGSMIVRVSPPRNSAARAGLYHLHFVAISPNYAGETGTADTDLTLLPYYEFLTSGPSPRVVQLSRSHPAGDAELVIVNKSNAETSFLVQTNDDLNELIYDCVGGNVMGPGQSLVTLGAGESKRLGLQLRARKMPLFGLAHRSVNYTAGVLPTNQPDQQQTLMGEARIHPKINFFLLLLFLLLLLIIAGAVFQPRITSFGFSDNYEERVFIPYGGSTELRWKYSVFATTATLYTSDDTDAEVLKHSTGSKTVSPKVSTSYILETENLFSRLTHITHTWMVEVLVVPDPPAIEAFYPNTNKVNSNTQVSLTWSVNKNAERAQSHINNLVTELGPDDFAGHQEYTLTKDVLAALKAYNSSGYDTRSFFLNVIPEKIDLVRYAIWVRPSGIAVPEEGNGRKVTRWGELQAANQPAATVTAAAPAAPLLNGADAAAAAALPTETAAPQTLLLKPAEVKPQPRFQENALDIPDILPGGEGSQGNPEGQMFGRGTDFSVSQAQPTPTAGNTGELLIRPQEAMPTAVPANPNTGEFHTGAVPVSATAVPVNSPENNDVNKDFSIKYMEIVEDSSSESGYRVISYFPGYLLQQKEEILVEWNVDGVSKVKIDGLSDKEEKSSGMAYAYPEESAEFTLMAELGSLQKSFAMPVKVAGDAAEDEGSGKNCELKANATSLENPGSVMLNWTGGGNYRVQLLSSAAAEKEQAEADAAAEKEAEAKGETYTKPTNQALSGGIVADYLQPAGFMKMDVSKKTTFILNAYDGNGNVICSKTADINVKNSDEEKTALKFSLVNCTDANDEALPYNKKEKLQVGALGQTVNVNVKFSDWTKGKDPTGTVSISDGTSSCSMTYPVTSCKLTLKKTGTLKITATYSGDSNYAKASSNGLLKVIEKLNTTTALSEDDVIKYRRSASDTITLTDILSNLTIRTDSERLIANKYGLNPLGTDDYIPSGTLTYKVTGTCTGSSCVDITCALTLKTMELSCSSNREENKKDSDTGDVSVIGMELSDSAVTRVQVKYSGDDYFNASQSESVPFQKNALYALTLKLAGFTDTDNEALLSDTEENVQVGIVGQTVNVNVSLSDWVSGLDPTGTVLISDGTSTCSMTYPETSCQLTLKKAGTLAITATYSGDSNYAKAVARGSLKVIDKLNTQVDLSESDITRYRRSKTDSAVLVDILSKLTVRSESEQIIANKYGLNPLGTDTYTPTGTLTYTIGEGSCVLTLKTMDLSCSSNTKKNTKSSQTGLVSLFGIELSDTEATRVQIKYSGDVYFNASQSESIPFKPYTLSLAITSLDSSYYTNSTEAIYYPYLNPEDYTDAYEHCNFNGAKDPRPDDCKAVPNQGTVTVELTLDENASEMPSGKIMVTDGTASGSCTPVCIAADHRCTCDAILSFTSDSIGNKSLTATYPGDSNYPEATDTMDGVYIISAPSANALSTTAVIQPDAAGSGAAVTITDETANEPTDGEVMVYAFAKGDSDREITAYCSFDYQSGGGSANSCVLAGSYQEATHYLCAYYEGYTGAKSSWKSSYVCTPNVNKEQLTLSFIAPPEGSYYANKANFYYPVNPLSQDDPFGYCNPTSGTRPTDCDELQTSVTPKLRVQLSSGGTLTEGTQLILSDGTTATTCALTKSAEGIYTCDWASVLIFANKAAGKKTLTAKFPGNTTYDAATVEEHLYVLEPKEVSKGYATETSLRETNSTASVTVKYTKDGQTKEAEGPVYVYAFGKDDDSRAVLASCSFDYTAGGKANSCQLSNSFDANTQELCAVFLGKSTSTVSYLPSRGCLLGVASLKINSISRASASSVAYYDLDAALNYTLASTGDIPTGTVTFTQGEGSCAVVLSKDSVVCQGCGDECSASFSGTTLKLSDAEFQNAKGYTVELSAGSVTGVYSGDTLYRKSVTTFDYSGGWIEELSFETPATGSYYGTKSGFYFPADPKSQPDPFAYCNPASGTRPADCSPLETSAEVKVNLVLGGTGPALAAGTTLKLSDGSVTKTCTLEQGTDDRHYSCVETFNFTASGESAGQKTITASFEGTSDYPMKNETLLEYIEVMDPDGSISTKLEITLPKVKIITQTGKQTEVSGLYAEEENLVTVRVSESSTSAKLASGTVMLYLYDADDPDIVMDSCVIENYPSDSFCSLTPSDGSPIVTVRGVYLGNASKGWAPSGTELTDVLVKYRNSYDTILTLNEMTGVNTGDYRLYTIKGTIDYNNGTKTEKPTAGGQIQVSKGSESCTIAFEQSDECWCGTAACTVSWDTGGADSVFTITEAKLDTAAANWSQTVVRGVYKTYDIKFNDAPVTTLENVDPGRYELSLQFDKPADNVYVDANDSSLYYPADPHQYPDPYGHCNPYASGESQYADCVQLSSSLPVTLKLTAPGGSPNLSGQALQISDGGDHTLSCGLEKVSGTDVQYTCTPASDLAYQGKATGPRTLTAAYDGSVAPYFTSVSVEQALYVVNLKAGAAATTTVISEPVKKSVHHLYDTVAVSAAVSKSGTTETVNEGTVEVFYYDPDDSAKTRLSSCSYTMPAESSCALKLLKTFGPNMMLAAEYTGSGTYLPSVGMLPIIVQDVEKVTTTLVIDSMTGTKPGVYDGTEKCGGLYDAQLMLSYAAADLPAGAAFSGTVTLTKGSESCVLTYADATCSCGDSCAVAWTETTKSGTVTRTAKITNMELDADAANRDETTVVAVYSGDQLYFNPAKAVKENVTAAKFAAPTLTITAPAAEGYYDLRNSGQYYPQDPSLYTDPYDHCNPYTDDESHKDCVKLESTAIVSVDIAYSSTYAPLLMDGATLNVTDGDTIRQCTLDTGKNTCTIQAADPFTFTTKGDKTLTVYSEGETYYGTLKAESAPYHVVSLPDLTTVTITSPTADTQQEAGETLAVTVAVVNNTRTTENVVSGKVTVNYYDTADPENPLSTCSYTLPGASSCSLKLVKESTATMALKAEYTSSDTDLLRSCTSDSVPMTVKVTPTLSIDSMTGTEPGYYTDTDTNGGLYDGQMTLSYPADVLPSGTAFSGTVTLTKGTESCVLTYGNNNCTCGTLCYVEWTSSTTSDNVIYTANFSDMELDNVYANRTVTTVSGAYSDGDDSQNFYPAAASKDKVFAAKFDAPAVTFTAPETGTYYDLLDSGKKYPEDPASQTDPYGYCNGTDPAPSDCVELKKTTAVTVTLIYDAGAPKLKEGEILWVTDGGSRAECKLNADLETCNVDTFEFTTAGLRTLNVSYDGNNDYPSFSGEASPYYVISLPSDPESRHKTSTVITSPENGKIYTVGDQITVQAVVTDTTDNTQKVKGTVFIYDKERNLMCSFPYDSEAAGSNHCNLSTQYSVTMLPLYAEFSGSTTWAPSISEPVSVSVHEKQLVDTAPTVKPETSAMYVGKEYTVTMDLFHVGSEYSLLNSAEGSLKLFTASEEVCEISLPASGAECTVSPKSAGTLKLYAIYSGDSALNTSTSAVVSVKVIEETCTLSITSVTLPSKTLSFVNDVYSTKKFSSSLRCYWYNTNEEQTDTMNIVYKKSCSEGSSYPLDGTFKLSYSGVGNSGLTEKHVFYKKAATEANSSYSYGAQNVTFTVPFLLTYLRMTQDPLLNAGLFKVTYEGDSHYAAASASLSGGGIVSTYPKSDNYSKMIVSHIRAEANEDSPALEDTELTVGTHYYLEIAPNGSYSDFWPNDMISNYCWDGYQTDTCKTYFGYNPDIYFEDPVYIPVGFTEPGVYRPEALSRYPGINHTLHAGFTVKVHGSDTPKLLHRVEKISYIGTDCLERYSGVSSGSQVMVGEGLRLVVTPYFSSTSASYTEGELLGSLTGTVSYPALGDSAAISLNFGQVTYSGGNLQVKNPIVKIDSLKNVGTVNLTLQFTSSNVKVQSYSEVIENAFTVIPGYLYIYPEETDLSEAKAAGDGDYTWKLAHKDTSNAEHGFKLYLNRGGDYDAYCKMPILNSDFSTMPTMQIQKDGTAMSTCTGGVDTLGQYYYHCWNKNYGASITDSGQKIRGIVTSSDFFSTPQDDKGTLVTKLESSEDMNGVAFKKVSVGDSYCGDNCNWLDYNNKINVNMVFTVPAASSPTPTGTIKVTAERDGASAEVPSLSLNYDLNSCIQNGLEWVCPAKQLSVQYGGYYVLTAEYSGDANYPAQTREYDTYVYFMPHDLAYDKTVTGISPMEVLRTVLASDTCAFTDARTKVGDISTTDRSVYEFLESQPLGGCDGGRIRIYLGTTVETPDVTALKDRLTAFLTITSTDSSVVKSSVIEGSLNPDGCVSVTSGNYKSFLQFQFDFENCELSVPGEYKLSLLVSDSLGEYEYLSSYYDDPPTLTLKNVQAPKLILTGAEGTAFTPDASHLAYTWTGDITKLFGNEVKFDASILMNTDSTSVYCTVPFSKANFPAVPNALDFNLDPSANICTWQESTDGNYVLSCTKNWSTQNIRYRFTSSDKNYAFVKTDSDGYAYTYIVPKQVNSNTGSPVSMSVSLESGAGE